MRCLMVVPAERCLVQSPVEKTAATPDHFYADDPFQWCSCADLKLKLLKHVEELFQRCACADPKWNLLKRVKELSHRCSCGDPKSNLLRNVPVRT